jgi:hypothetical protein
VERLALVDHRKHFGNQLIALEVGELAQLGRASKMRSIEGIAPGASQGAFFGDFD